MAALWQTRQSGGTSLPSLATSDGYVNAIDTTCAAGWTTSIVRLLMGGPSVNLDGILGTWAINLTRESVDSMDQTPTCGNGCTTFEDFVSPHRWQPRPSVIGGKARKIRRSGTHRQPATERPGALLRAR